MPPVRAKMAIASVSWISPPAPGGSSSKISNTRGSSSTRPRMARLENSCPGCGFSIISVQRKARSSPAIGATFSEQYLRKSAGDTSAAEKFKALRGVGHTNPTAAAVFTAASMSMIGIPIFAGFIPKLLFATSAFGNHPAVTYIVLVALSISTLLNVAYFLRTVITLYTPAPTHELSVIPARSNIGFLIAGVLLIALNIAIGLHAQPILDLFEKGIRLFISVR